MIDGLLLGLLLGAVLGVVSPMYHILESAYSTYHHSPEAEHHFECKCGQAVCSLGYGVVISFVAFLITGDILSLLYGSVAMWYAYFVIGETLFKDWLESIPAATTVP